MEERKLTCRECRFGRENENKTGWCTLKGREVTLDAAHHCKLGTKSVR